MFAAEDALGLDRGSIRATVLIETITAAFEMDEILYELRDHICGLNAGRWDYIFSVAKRFHTDPAFVLPDRSPVTDDVTVHAGVHRAAGEDLPPARAPTPSAAWPPSSPTAASRRSPRPPWPRSPTTSGARPATASTAPGSPIPTWWRRPGPSSTPCSATGPTSSSASGPRSRSGAAHLLDVSRPPDGITRAGLDTNISVGLRYLASWLSGTGAAAIDDLMEDAATAEISRAQVWQWVHHQVTLSDGTPVTAALVRQLLDEAVSRSSPRSATPPCSARPAPIFEQVALADDFPAFLTLPAYELLP